MHKNAVGVAFETPPRVNVENSVYNALVKERLGGGLFN